MAIGIDETKYIRKNTGSFNDKIGESKSYALWSNGNKTKWDSKEIIKADKNTPVFNTDDIVHMILDLSSKQLCYKINDDEKYVAFTNITTGYDVNYCMAVFISRYNNSMQLLQCTKLC